jgi:GH43 family beta-xylosidase
VAGGVGCIVAKNDLKLPLPDWWKRNYFFPFFSDYMSPVILLFALLVNVCCAENYARLVRLHAPDPFVTKWNGEYYLMFTYHGDHLSIFRSKTLDFTNALQEVNIFQGSSQNLTDVWAPELWKIGDRWIVYFAGSERNYILRSRASGPDISPLDPAGYEFVGRMVMPGRPDLDTWAIDPTVLKHPSGQMYFVWSSQGPQAPSQSIAIAPLAADGLSLTAPHVYLSHPELPFELNGKVNEGPAPLVNDRGEVFLAYSANGCWTADYSLGLLTLKMGQDPMIPTSWIKSNHTILHRNDAKSVYGPGHNSFTFDENGNHAVVYHAKYTAGGCDDERHARVESFSFNADGSINLDPSAWPLPPSQDTQ